ncbi:hypothetical protein GCM10010909_07800 [Acidocella aquatica]|uniref:FAD-binding domain-containing protein n=1 Tax=Acidocella aquatica TaxID=1922313 RepID=A0ABQ6A485_9PROT|nr:5-demethoxyubiquinol-8 5-hydroxylase UbiM [Acidocella aquatica]GLR66102.1 hypothetical protein GCM10010909_07800 [Acidocella aquatica]
MAASAQDYDVIIIGAGPAGLSLAGSLAAQGRKIALVEKCPRESLESPAFDGRDIALTHRSVELLRGLGAWAHIPAAEISPLGEAQVRNGNSPRSLRFAPPRAQAGMLGQLVPNHLIRRALFAASANHPNIHLLANTAASAIHTSADSASLTLADGTTLTAPLIAAADTRFSEMRRRMGIPARIQDFGKTMLVCRMAHEQPHHGVATEWFGFGQTIATLPLNGTESQPNMCSLVVTLPTSQAEALMALTPETFAAEMSERYQHQLGAMQLVSTRHAYPLAAAYAGRFVAGRFALVGDAAVGMHPVTAHGFNFGLSGQHILATLIAGAAGQDIGAPALLRRYESRHRRATLPLYLATNATALLYTDDRPPARALRGAVISAGAHLPLVRRILSSGLMKGAPRPLTAARALIHS